MPESVSAIEAQAEYFANIPIIDRTYRASVPLNFFICIDSDLRYLSEEQGPYDEKTWIQKRLSIKMF